LLCLEDFVLDRSACELRRSGAAVPIEPIPDDLILMFAAWLEKEFHFPQRTSNVSTIRKPGLPNNNGFGSKP
jgi:hypothetical protein